MAIVTGTFVEFVDDEETGIDDDSGLFTFNES